MTPIKIFNETTDELLNGFPIHPEFVKHDFNFLVKKYLTKTKVYFRGWFLHCLRWINYASFALLIQNKPRLVEVV